ncbi:MAG: hypothetical protein KBT33_08520 [Prevotellaceae bacterium]|nr:hypothetical protein [Candidatus Minthosoma equi]
MKKILLSLAALLVCSFASADNEYTLGEELTLEQVKAGTPFIIANAAGDVVVYGTNGNQSALKSPTEAGNSSNAYYFKLSAIAGNAEYETALDAARNAAENAFDGEATNDNFYLFRVGSLNGENFQPWSLWGNSELYVSHCGWTSNCNGLNLGENKFGADAWYNTIWNVVAEDGGYTLQSQSRGNHNYFSGQGKPDAKVVLKFYSGLVEGDPLPEDEPWVCPTGEIDFTTLPVVGTLLDNNIGVKVGGGAVVYGSQSDGSNYTDVTAYESVKFYGTPGLSLRLFVNREGSSGVTVGKTEQQLTINAEGFAVMDVQAVMDATEKEYCYLSCAKTNWGDGGKVEGITVVEKAAPVTYTIDTAVGKIGTVALDYPATITGATLYEVVGFSTTEGLAIAEVEGNMVGGTPYIYVASADEVVCTKTGASVEHGDFDCTKSEVGNGLVGCYVQVTPADWWFDFIRNGYVISNGELRQISKGNVTIPANRCFFDSAKCTDNSMASAKMIIAPEEDVTAIKNVNAALEGGKIYDINGREVKSMQKGGIYVVGGMKVMVK